MVAPLDEERLEESAVDPATLAGESVDAGMFAGDPAPTAIAAAHSAAACAADLQHQQSQSSAPQDWCHGLLREVPQESHVAAGLTTCASVCVH